MSISKEQLKEEIKKQLFQQMLEQKMVDEGVTDFLKSMSQKALSGVSSVAKKGADALQTTDVDEKKLDKIADFLQTAQQDPEISKLILTTKLGKAILGGEEQNKSLQEILTGDFAQMMKAKKITNADIDDFIKAMSANPKARKMLKDVEIDVPQAQPDKSSTPSQTQPNQQATQKASTEPSIPDISGGPALKKQELDQAFLRKIITDLTKFKESNRQVKKKILNKIMQDLKNMAETEGEKDLRLVSQLQEILIQEIFNALTGKDK